MHPRLNAWAALTLTFVASSAQPVEPGRYLAANCANCHGTHGKAQGAMPSLAGRSAAEIEAQMKAFRDGTRSATLMHQIAKGYSDAQIAAIAQHIARQKH